MGMEKMMFGVVALLIGILLLTSMAPTVSTETSVAKNSTGGTLGTVGALVNLSGTSSATIYGLYDLMWAIFGLLLVAGGAFSLYKSITD